MMKKKYVNILKENLERDGYDTLVAYDGAKVVEMAPV